ncbi:SWIM zinc finger family protein [Rhodococcus chondri]|uniref:SWIM zinc finger family protein n=1 Tax=Rhodococcus chondri TaxID=3065941 RepID=A0ABU7JXS7_9NOCA|nr:SWIM zinc finger family protein [Rhodococcus sp. CC-R104]MEE2034821.1 SWIM zinc finger family protein [Rhodococcus sp. CC-R104]
MTTPWSPAQITAAAPDSSSASAARELGPQWTETGRSAHALWGLCRGSGTNPYRTAVDLNGPAYRCSCPSRKFPCKHALSLLMLWSAETLPEATAPAFVTEWLDKRATAHAETADGAASPAAVPDPPNTPDSATALRRAQRVAAGLDELDRWLTDRVRNGLGAVDHGYSTYDAMAARMVDAQAPGVAGALRALPAVVATETDWPSKALTEYARLHLLIRAYRNIDALPEPLARTVQMHLGFSTRSDEVRRRPAVRDRWSVLAARITEESRMFTRKVWLRGRTTGKWAVLLDFAHGSARFPTDVPLPGTETAADLHFYPGSAPLRAQFGAQHGSPEPVGALPATGLDTALDDYADALAADPWIRSWPMLLAAVTPVCADGRWTLVDQAGRAVPLGGADDDRWRLLAVAGGRPATVCGDWDGRAFTAASLFAGDTELAL